MTPLNLVLRAGPWVYFGTPSHSPRSRMEDPFSLGRKSSHQPHHCTAPGESETHMFPWTKHHSLWRPGPEHGAFFLSATPPNHTKSLGSFPQHTGVWDWKGCQAIFKPVGQRVFPGCQEGVRGLEEGEEVEWPPSFSPDQGEEMQVH